MNYNDYIEIMDRELKVYRQIDIDENNIEKVLTKNKSLAEDLVKTLFLNGDIEKKPFLSGYWNDNNKKGQDTKDPWQSSQIFLKLREGLRVPPFQNPQAKTIRYS